jgi:uncharacterized protein
MSPIPKKQDEKQIRTCIVTGEKLNKADMIRIVSFRGENLQLDLTGKKEGRGCYVSAKQENLEKLLAKNASVIARNFKRQIRPEEIEYIKEEFPKLLEEKLFRPRISKPVAVRIKREDLEKIKKDSV